MVDGDKPGQQVADDCLPGTADSEDYEIVSVRPTSPPTNMSGKSWHCYVIAQGRNTIRGYRQGNLNAVTASVEELVLRLNERRLGKRYPGNQHASAQGKPGNRK